MKRLTALLVLVLAAPAQAQVDRTVTAGALTATVTADPFAIAYSNGLRQTGAALGGAAATRIVDERREGDAYLATLATADGAGRTLALRLEPDADGILALTLSAPGSSDGVRALFAAAPGERFLGFGERSHAVDMRGTEVRSYVAEGPYQPVEEPFIAAFVPPPGYDARPDATYFPMPWLLSTRGYGVLSDDLANPTFDFRGANEWSVAAEGPALRLRVFAGPRPKDVLRRFSDRIGRQPALPAPWLLGAWWQPKGDEAEQLKKLQAAGAAGSVAQTYTHYLPCADHTDARAAQRERTKRFHDAGLAVTTYFNPMICTDHPRFGAAAAAGVLTRNAAGDAYRYRYTGSAQFFVGQFDFSHPQATAFYGSLLAEALDDGYDGWMEDFGEYTPLDSVSHDGLPGPQAHNLYPTLYHRGAASATATAGRTLARFTRSGWTGTAQHTPVVWGGDPTTSWGFDGLQSAVRNGLSMGLSGVSRWGSDIGGFFALSEPQTTPELLIRWLQFGLVSGVMRTQANGFDLYDQPRAQITDAEVLPHWTRNARLRTQLVPYLEAAEREYSRSGMPVMRHLALAYPDDPKATARDDEFLFGPDLLAAPVLAPGATERALYLPAGRWVDVWRSVALDARGVPQLGAPKLLDGGRDHTLPAPLDQLPLLAREGALIALLDPDTPLRAPRPNRLHVVGWPRPGGLSGASIGSGERVSVRRTRTRLNVRIAGRRTRTYELQLAGVPKLCKRTNRGIRVLRSRQADGVLRARVRTRDGVLVWFAGCR